MRSALVVCFVIFALGDIYAETYRLKALTTVDIIENGEVVGTKKLKKGTLLEVPCLAESDKKGFTNNSSTIAEGKSNSTMPLKLFLNKRPKAGAMFRVKLSLGDYYNYDFSEKKNSYWSLSLQVYRPDGENYDLASGYMKKSNVASKKMMELLKDGNEHLAFCKLLPVTNPDDDSVLVETFVEISDKE